MIFELYLQQDSIIKFLCKNRPLILTIPFDLRIHKLVTWSKAHYAGDMAGKVGTFILPETFFTSRDDITRR